MTSEPPHTFYERLFAMGHEVELVKNEEGEVIDRIPRVIHADLALAYSLLIKMRNALAICRDQFAFYAKEHRTKLDDHMTMVERQDLDGKIQRNENIAKALATIVDEIPVREALADWLDISTAPRTGQQIRVLGKLQSGTPYVETTHWYQIRWAIQLMEGYGPPSHWQPLERPPEGY